MYGNKTDNYNQVIDSAAARTAETVIKIGSIINRKRIEFKQKVILKLKDKSN